MKRKRDHSRCNPEFSEPVGANNTSMNSDDHSGVETTKAASTLRYPNAALQDPVLIEKTNVDNPIRGRNPLKNVASFAAELSKDVGSSSTDLLTNNLPLYIGKGPRLSRQDSQHNEKELHAALSVIKEIMKMDVAMPFSSPVDPVALGIPDYFDVIDTPMDFGTICNTIELGVEYENSKDVYKDVELIWLNCFKYNKNGSYILELMKKVKDNFTKHWNAAGLYWEQEEANNVQVERNLPQASGHGMPNRHSCPAGSLISDSFFQEHPDSIGPCQLQQKHNQPCCGHVDQPKKVSSQCRCQWNYGELHSSQPQKGVHMAADGHFCSPVHGLFSSSTCKCEHDCTLGPMTGNTNYQREYQMSSDHNHGCQKSSVCAEQYHPQQRSHQCHSNLIKCSGGTEPDVTHNLSAGSHLHSPLESSLRLTKRRLEYSLASLTCKHCHQQHYQMDPGQIGSSLMIHNHSYQPQQQCYQCNLASGPQDHLQPPEGANIGVEESTVRHDICGVESSAVPVSDDGSQEQECQTDPSESELPPSDHSPSHEPKGNDHLSQPSSSPQSEPSSAQAEENHCNGDPTNLARKTHDQGPTRCPSMLREGKRISITTNEAGEPVGREAQKFIRYLGILARDGHVAPLTYVDWRALPEANKEKMWEEIQAKFEIDPSCKTWVLKSICKKWKDWKAKLKMAHYNTHATDEERLADWNVRVLPDQWAYLVSHWSSEEAEKCSARNKANRAQQKFGHATGTKSFARIREEERAKRPDGKVPTRTELFILTRTRRDGRPVNEASSAVISQLKDIASQEKDTSKSNTSTDDFFSQVIGRDKRGHVRCSALDPPHSELGTTKPTHAEAIQMASKANAEVQEMKDKLVAVEQTCAQMATQMATMISMMSSMNKTITTENIPNQVPNNSGTSETSPSQQAKSTPLRRSKRRGKV